MFKLLKSTPNGVRIGKDAGRGRYDADRRPLLNTDGTYTVKTIKGTTINTKVVAQRDGAKVEIPFHGETILIPITQVARSIKVDDRGQPVKIAEGKQ